MKKNGIELDGRVLGMEPKKIGKGMMKQKNERLAFSWEGRILEMKQKTREGKDGIKKRIALNWDGRVWLMDEAKQNRKENDPTRKEQL